MSLFCPCDDINYKIFIPQVFLNRYKNSTLYNLNERKKRRDSIDIYNDAIIVDVERDILLIINEFIINDFNLDKIPFLHNIFTGIAKDGKDLFISQNGHKLEKIYHSLIYLGFSNNNFNAWYKKMNDVFLS